MSKKSVLNAAVRRVKGLGLVGKLRDDAIRNFTEGAHAARPGIFGPGDPPLAFSEVIEALAEIAADEDQAAEAEVPADAIEN